VQVEVHAPPSEQDFAGALCLAAPSLRLRVRDGRIVQARKGCDSAPILLPASSTKTSRSRDIFEMGRCAYGGPKAASQIQRSEGLALDYDRAMLGQIPRSRENAFA